MRVNIRTALGVLLALSAILLFVDLGGSSIWDANEAFYVETPRQMVLTGDYVSPSFNGQPRFNKPVLSYWVVAGFYKAFGISVQSERLAIAFGALMMIGATWVIGRTIAGRDTGLLAALIVSSAPRVMLLSRRIVIDVYFASFLAVALMGLVLARAHPNRRRQCLVVMYAGLGLAMLTKGPVALVMPGLALLVFLLWTRGLGELRRMMLPAGLLIIAAIVLPWYVMDYQQHGWVHIKEFFIGENVGRYTDTVGVQDRGWLFYLPVLLTDLQPWALFLPAAIWAAWRARRADTQLLIAWTAAFVGVFTFSSTKQDLYIYPVVPAVAVLIADLLASAIGGDGKLRLSATVRRLTTAGAALTGLVLMLVGGLVFYLTSIAYLIPNLPQLGAVGAALIVGGVVAAALCWRSDLRPTILTLAVTAVVVNWLLVTFVMRPFEQFKPVAPISAWLVTHAPATTMVAHYRTVLPSMAFYLGRPITPVFDVQAMRRLVDEQASMYVLLRPHEFDELRTNIPARLCVLERRTLPVFDAKLKEILSGKLPEIWLAGVKDACQ